MEYNSSEECLDHYNDVIMGTIAYQITSPRLFTQPFIQTQIGENIKAPRHWPLCVEFTGTGEFPAQRASYTDHVSIWWRYHLVIGMKCFSWSGVALCTSCIFLVIQSCQVVLDVSRSPLTFNGIPGNIQGSFHMLRYMMNTKLYFIWIMIPTRFVMFPYHIYCFVFCGICLMTWICSLYIQEKWQSINQSINRSIDQTIYQTISSLQWRHNGRDGVSDHRRLDCLLNHLFRRRSNKIWQPRLTGLCNRNPPVTSGFLSQRARNAENVSI